MIVRNGTLAWAPEMAQGYFSIIWNTGEVKGQRLLLTPAAPEFKDFWDPIPLTPAHAAGCVFCFCVNSMHVQYTSPFQQEYNVQIKHVYMRYLIQASIHHKATRLQRHISSDQTGIDGLISLQQQLQ